MHDFKPFKTELEGIYAWLKKELSVISTGRANPALLDRVMVSSYGSLMPLNTVANISNEDPRTLRISPWDSSQIRPIEKALIDANLGVSVSVDDKGLRVAFPELTAERRTAMAKTAWQKAEEAKVSVRSERNKEMEKIDKKEKNKEISEDDKKRLKDALQKHIDEANAAIEQIASQKEKEIVS